MLEFIQMFAVVIRITILITLVTFQNTVLEAVINSLPFSTTLLVLVIFSTIMDTLHSELIKIGDC